MQVKTLPYLNYPVISRERFGAGDDVASRFKRTVPGHREVVAPSLGGGAN